MRSVQTIRRVVGLGALASLLAAPLVGCATAVRPPLARRPEGLPSTNRGQSSAMVFAGPEVALAMQGTPEWVRPEYWRNDENLSYAPPRALTAIDEWPQPAPPTIERARRTTLSRQASSVLIFGRPRDRGDNYDRRRYSPRPR